MKKRYIILAGILAAAVVAAGCGKKKEEAPSKDAQVTVAPAEKTEQPKDEGALVDMQKSTEENIKNVMGNKTASASKTVFVNQTGAEVSRIYVRPNTDDDEDWGDDLVAGKFTLKNGDKALYYFDKTIKDANGNSVTSYDIRIVYTDENRSECYFRKIPLQTITQITLRMDGSGDSAIPFATYLSGTGKKETSTLNEVKRRLGLSEDSEEQDTENKDSQLTPTPAPGNPEPSATPAPENPDNQDPGTDDSPTDEHNAGASAAEGYIGQSLDALIGALGEPSGSDYENEPETGETGYHYYNTSNGSFTVSTTVDENGNEVVAGVW